MLLSNRPCYHAGQCKNYGGSVVGRSTECVCLLCPCKTYKILAWNYRFDFTSTSQSCRIELPRHHLTVLLLFTMSSPTNNSAWTIPSSASKVSDLTKQTKDIPTPGPNQVLVKLTAASLNFRDVLISTRSPYCNSTVILLKP
jgi:hypothetical protein